VLAQNIQTIVGGGNPAGPALSAYVAGPTDLVEDSKGNIYISDIDEEYVLKLDTSGNVSIYAGTGYSGWGGIGGPATKAVLSTPVGLAIDPNNNLYIADFFGQHIWKINGATGVLTNVAGSATFTNPLGNYSGDGGPATKAQLNAPQGVAVLNGTIAIADAANNVVREVNKSGIITTYAGVQTAPCSNPIARCGDGGLAAAANLNYPVSVAFDSAGNLYIADALDNRIRKVSKATGKIATVAGNGSTCVPTSGCGDGGLATNANLDYPEKVWVDKLGNIYIADEFNNKIRFVNATTKIISTLAGNGQYLFAGDGGPATSASFADPTGLFVDSAGDLIIADQGSNRVRKVTAGIINSIAGGGTGGDGLTARKSVFAFSYDMVVDSAGNQFIIDFDTSRIRRVDAKTKVVTTVAGNGTAGYYGDGGSATSAALDYPRGLTLDAAGDIFVADSANWVVREVRSGMIFAYAGDGNFCVPSGFASCGNGGPATAAQLAYPESTVMDAAGNLYVADTYDNWIRKVDHSTQHLISTVVGDPNGVACALGTDPCGDGGQGTSAKLSLPTGLAIDAAGNLYIADSGDNRVRVYNPSTGIISAYAFDGNPTFKGDGGPALSASMQQPNKVAIDSAGNIYLAGGFDNVVRKVAAGMGTVTSVAGDAQNPLGFGFAGDGGPATKAILSNRGIAVTPAGDLYIPDNNRVRFVPHASEE
jgi:sugar lactone lactonase YvrE